jgi:hypothetical protein
MRTQEEILEKIGYIENGNWMGMTRLHLVKALTFENAKPFLSSGATSKSWEGQSSITNDEVKRSMANYLNSAYEGFGLQGDKSMERYYAWIWLIGEEEVFGDIREHGNYSIDYLNKIAEFLGVYND